MAGKPTTTYRKYHIDKADERRGLFEGLVERFGVGRALYPGSFVHVTPSFVIPEVVYVDSDKRAAAFFAGAAFLAGAAFSKSLRLSLMNCMVTTPVIGDHDVWKSFLRMNRRKRCECCDSRKYIAV